jgi:hypothetical protein
MERHVFNRQPARAVLVDLQQPMDALTYINIQQALSDILYMLAHMSGPARVPLLSISVLRGYTECLFPLQPIKGNLPRLQGALGELRSFADELSAGQRRSYMRSSLFDGIQEALMQFKRHFHSVKQDVPSSSSNFPSQVEIVILSSCDIPTLQKSILRIIEQLELENLKKIQIVCVNDPDKVIQQTEDELDQLDITDGDSPNELCLSLFDVASCSNDVTSLQSLLKSWMFDCSTDSEHVQITLPSHGHPLILKCDLQERMIQPSLLSSFTKNLVRAN